MSEDIELAADVAVEGRGAEIALLKARLLQAELRTEAVRAGMVDLDGVKLIEASTLRISEAGELIDGAGVMAALRASKPWLFGRGNSSSAAQAPRAEPVRAKKAMEMTVEEWRAARAELLQRR